MNTSKFPLVTANDNWNHVIYVDHRAHTIEVLERHESDRASTPRDVYNGHAAQWRVGAVIYEAEWLDLCESTRACRAAIYEGHSTEWDGQNHVAVYTPEAEEQREALHATITAWAEGLAGTCWEIGDYFDPCITYRDNHAALDLGGGQTVRVYGTAGERQLRRVARKIAAAVAADSDNLVRGDALEFARELQARVNR